MAEGPVKLNIGCGLDAPPKWVNIDGSWNARLAKRPLMRRVAATIGIIPRSSVDVPWPRNVRIHNVLKPLPFEDASVDAVFASHLLEHLYRDDALRVLRECHRVLRDGGACRLIVPDLRAIVEEYLAGENRLKASEGDSSETPADRMNDRLLLRSRSGPKGSWIARVCRSLWDFHSHKWMYDADSLARIMTEAGFVDAHERALHDTDILDIEGVERPDRVEGGAGVIVEAVKRV